MTMPAGITNVAPPWGFGNGAGGGGATHSPLSPSLGGGADKALQIYLPEIYPIPNSANFNPLGSAATVGAEAGTVLAACTLRLAQNYVGVIRGFSVYLNNMLATTNVTWSLLINGVAPAGFGNVSMFPRVASFVSNNFDCLIRVPNGAQITVAFTNTDGGSYNVGASYSGWQWSEADGQRWIGGQV